jgi:kinetochore protein Mis13/DSN1
MWICADSSGRLKQERAGWETLKKSAVLPTPTREPADSENPLSPIHPDLLDSPQRALLEDLDLPTAEPVAVQQRLKSLTEDLEFKVDLYADSVHAVGVSRDAAERLADRTLATAAETLEERDKGRKAGGQSKGRAMDAFDALRALGRVMNAPQRARSQGR